MSIIVPPTGDGQSPDLADLVARIRSEAAVASRAGQSARLEAIADELEASAFG